MVNLKLVKTEWVSGVNKETKKPWIALEITLQGSEKFTVSQKLFLNDMQCQLLGITKPKS